MWGSTATPFRKPPCPVHFLFSSGATCYLPRVPVRGSPGANHMCPPPLWRLATYWPWDRYPGPFPRGASGGGDKAEHREGGSPSIWSVCLSPAPPHLLFFPHTPSSPGWRQCYRERCPLLPVSLTRPFPSLGPMLRSEMLPGSCISKLVHSLCPHTARTRAQPAQPRRWVWGSPSPLSVLHSAVAW